MNPLDKANRGKDLLRSLPRLEDQVTALAAEVAALTERVTALEAAVGSLHGVLEQADPVGTRQIITSVQEQVAAISAELTDEMGRLAAAMRHDSPTA